GGAAAGGGKRRRGGDRADVREDAGAALAVAPQGDRRGALEHLDSRLGGDQLGEAGGDRASGLGASRVDDAARRVTPLEPEGQGAVGLEAEADAEAAQPGDRTRR